MENSAAADNCCELVTPRSPPRYGGSAALSKEGGRRACRAWRYTWKVRHYPGTAFCRRRRRQDRPAALSIDREPYQPAYSSAIAAEAAARALAECHRRLVYANPVSKQDY